MNRSLMWPLFVAVVLITLGTALQGSLSQRWGKVASAKLDEFAARLADVPMNIGSWEAEDSPVDPQQLAASNVAGHLSRVYRHASSGDEVHLFLVCGDARNIALHTPQWCYRAVGFEMLGEPELHEVSLNEASSASLLAAAFTKETAAGAAKLEVFWTFGDESGWHGHRYPRTALAGRLAVYKLYLIRSLSRDGTKNTAQNSCAEFASELLPRLQAALNGRPEEHTPTESASGSGNRAESR